VAGAPGGSHGGSSTPGAAGTPGGSHGGSSALGAAGPPGGRGGISAPSAVGASGGRGGSSAQARRELDLWPCAGASKPLWRGAPLDPAAPL
jgi:hypothetical protein